MLLRNTGTVLNQIQTLEILLQTDPAGSGSLHVYCRSTCTVQQPTPHIHTFAVSKLFLTVQLFGIPNIYINL